MGQISETNSDILAQPASESESVNTSINNEGSPANSNLEASADSLKKSTEELNVLATTNEESFMSANLAPSIKYEEEGHGYFHWVIDDWTQLPDRATSTTFTVAGHDWDILLFPRGNQVEDTVSLYIEYKPRDDAQEGWHACAQFCLAMSNVDEAGLFTYNSAHHRFNAEESDWGFTRFLDIRRLMSPLDADSRPLLENRRVRISAYVRVIKDTTGVLWHNFHNYDSRKQTGYVGLRNQGATCYMNSLLQSLYFTNEFRNAVYQIPTENDDPKRSVALALQRVFYNLQVSPEPVDTTELTKSFGWDSLESFMQHDVQEFNRVLQDNLETKMKGTVADGAIARLFEGKMKSYIRCVNVKYESSRVENYYDISLNVKGCATLRDSFANYCEVEMLDGENKYQAEGYGLQDARKGVIFESFPPVLQLQLKRFEYDFMRDAMVKINDRHEFPPTIDLAEFLSDEADRSMSWNYVLHGVLVHSGDLHGGHYFGLLRPTADDKWYRFDDDRVVPVTRDEVFEEYYGGEFPNAQPQGPRSRMQGKRFTNAYMLVYIREALYDQVLCSGDAPVPEHLLRRIQEAKDEEARRQREKVEMANTIPVKVVGDEHFTKHQGFDLCYFDDRQPSSNALFSERMPKAMTLPEFKKLYAKHIGRSPEDFRFWSMVGRVNKTTRCDIPLVSSSPELTLAQIKESRALKWPDLRLYCELRDESSPADFAITAPPPGTSLLHAKFYDPETGTISGVGRLYIRAEQHVGEIIPRLCELASLPADTPLRLFEEIKPSLIEEMDLNHNFHSAEIQTGDIVCFQVANNGLATRYPATIPEYFDDVQHRVRVRFIPKPGRNDIDEFAANDSPGADAGASEKPSALIIASSKTPYDKVSVLVANELKIRDHLKLRFYTVSPTGQARQAVRRSPTSTLNDMLPNMIYGQQPVTVDGLPEYVVMYERIEVNIDQIDNMRNIRVTYVGKSMKLEHQFEVLVPKTGKSQSLIEATYAKVEQALRSSIRSANDGSAPKPFSLSFYEVSKNRISRMLDGSEPLSQLGSPGLSDIVAMHQTFEESLAAAGDGDQDDTRMDTDIEPESKPRFVEVFHFYRDLMRAHSVPFLFEVFPGEMWPDTWARLERKLGLGEKELKNLGVVYGAQGSYDLKRCRVIQGSVSVDGGAATAPSTGQHTPAATPPPVDAATAADNAAKSISHATAALSNGSSPNSLTDANANLCLWDVIQQTTAAAKTEDGQEMEDDTSSSVAPLGFIALNHIDRASRHRGVHHERAIRILN